jgi:uncharacterized YccA/Bax inhibitor family protein
MEVDRAEQARSTSDRRSQSGANQEPALPNPLFNSHAFDGPGGTAVATRPVAGADDTYERYSADAAAAAAAGRGFAGPSDVPGTTYPSLTHVMTYGGTASVAFLMLAVAAVTGWFGWGQVQSRILIPAMGGQAAQIETTLQRPWLLGAALIVGFGLAIFTAFKPLLARFTALPYAAAQGVLLGMITHMYELRFNGIALQAVLATGGVFLFMLALYGMRILRATPRFVKGVMAATFGVVAMYLVGFIARLFGADLQFFNKPTALGIGISLVVVTIASLNLIIDFDVIERGVRSGAPKAMEWYGAFSLMVTLVWLYLEVLRLIALLRER